MCSLRNKGGGSSAIVVYVVVFVGVVKFAGERERRGGIMQLADVEWSGDVWLASCRPKRSKTRNKRKGTERDEGWPVLMEVMENSLAAWVLLENDGMERKG
ncbi:hypothetical protein HAX54_022504, partial [Datura stramonium]|nr:hypothetical protein [Datura stramonium]